MAAAIAARDITWHALPFSTHSELANRAMYDAGLAVSKRLDERFGVRTIAAKMTDVPGHTRGIVAPLVDAGVKILHIGVNAASPVPKVPPIFRLARFSGAGSARDVHGRLWRRDGDARRRACLGAVDDAGQSRPATGDSDRQDLRRPSRSLSRRRDRASDLSAFARELLADLPDVPVLTDEIGDTWITASRATRVASPT